jgi:ubiquitin-activating enzyme E1
MDFVTAASNLRATNYKIMCNGKVGADKLATKQIAGRIIPAVATATAMTTGGVILELIKFLQGHRDIDAYRKWYFNLGLNVFQPFAPSPCAVAPFGSREYSKWETIELFDAPLQVVLESIELATGLKISQVRCAFSDRNLHSRMPLDPTHVRLKRTCV